MEFKIITYAAYVVISLGLTYWVGNTLHKYGQTFLLDIFDQDEVLPTSINKLLLIGFYLINLGYILVNLITRQAIKTPIDMIELLSEKIGGIVIVLGIMHFSNILILFRMRTRAKKIAPTH